MELIVGMICLTVVILVKAFLQFEDCQQARKEYYENLGSEYIENTEGDDAGDWWKRSNN